MDYCIDDKNLCNELETRGIGYRDGDKYYVSMLEAAYLTEIGKLDCADALKTVNGTERLKKRYIIFKDLRKKMHTANYVERDDLFLVCEKGMVPKSVESKYVVVPVEKDITLERMIELQKIALNVRKVFICALVVNNSVEYYKFQWVEL
ncbi:MAG: hypothetical protein ACP5H8_01330 [Candidatus Micrarchaeia archaeon]